MRNLDKIELMDSTGNPFEDLNLPGADVEHMKVKLAVEIIAILNGRKLSTRQAEKLVGMDQADITRIRNADLRRFKIDRLVNVLNHLDRWVDVVVVKKASVISDQPNQL